MFGSRLQILIDNAGGERGTELFTKTLKLILQGYRKYKMLSKFVN